MRAPDCQLKVLKEKQNTLGDVCPVQVGPPVHQCRGSSRHSGVGENRDLSEGRGRREETVTCAGVTPMVGNCFSFR